MLKFFTVSIQDHGQVEAEVNAFLRRHKILTVDRRWVEQGAASFWSICIDYLEGSSAGLSTNRAARVPASITRNN